MALSLHEQYLYHNYTKLPAPKNIYHSTQDFIDWPHNMPQCLALDESVWSFCPNVGPALLFAVLFGLTTFAHIVQALIFRKWYCFVIIMGGTWELASFIFRTMDIYDQTNTNYYTVWFILILVAPIWINAYVYMIIGRMVYNFSARKKIWIVSAHRFGLYFVLLDIIAFFIQAAGAIIASGDNITESRAMLGIHIYMGGVGFQQLFIIMFAGLAVAFHRELKQTGAPQNVWRLLYAVYAVLSLITIRIIFRLAEYSNSYTGYAPNHEAFLYIFDALPMLTALVVLDVFHPGAVMVGKGCDLPSRKERKRQAKEANLDQHSFEDASPMATVQTTYYKERTFEV